MQADSLLPVPFPDLGALEAPVAEQLRQTQELLSQRLDTGVDGAGLARTYGELGRLYHAYGFTEPAEACYRNAMRLAPDDARWPYLLGHVRQTSGRLEEARESYERALTLRPGHVAALVRLGEVYAGLDRPDDAEQVLRRALAIDPSAVAARAALGRVELSRRRFAAAVEELETALEQAPHADRLHYPLAMAYRGLGRLDEAREHLARSGKVGLKADDPLVDELDDLVRGEAVHLIRGRMAFRAGRYRDAADEFRKAVAARPESARARVNLGTALGMIGERPAAIEEYRRALELDPDDATAHFNLGLLLAEDGDRDAALEHLAAAVRAEPDDPEARLRLARMLERAGEPEQALTQYEALLEIDEDSEGARLGEAETLVRMGRHQEARRRLEEARSALPESGLLAHALARLLAASPDPSVRDGEQALELALRVARARPSAPHLETVAMALAELGRCADAATWQRRALEATEPDAAAVRPARQAALERYLEGPPCATPGASRR